MMKRSTALFLVMLSLAIGLALEPGRPASADAEEISQDSGGESAAGLDRLRNALQDAYNRGDVEAMASYLHPDGVIIFPDGNILKGRDAFRDYYNRMLKGPDARVVSYSAEPVIESRTVHNDVGLSYGYMNDKYVLNDGQSFALNSRFTITVFKSPSGPTETDGWMVRSFHSSPDTFDNPILILVARTVFWRAGLGGAGIGLVLGLGFGFLMFRRKKSAAAND